MSMRSIIKNPKKRPAVVMMMALIFWLCFFGAVVAMASGGDAEGGHDAPSKGWVNEDWYRVMNFTALAIGLFFIAKKLKVSSLFNSRIDGIKDELDSLEAKKKEAVKELEQYQSKIETLESQSEKIIADYKAQGEEAKSRIIKEAEVAAAKLEEQAKNSIAFEFEKAQKDLKAGLVEKALEAAEKRIKNEIGEEAQNRLVNEYLEKVVAS